MYNMLKFTNFTNSDKLKVSLDIPDLEISLYEKLEILKENYYNILKEDCTVYDKIMEKTKEELVKVSVDDTPTDINLKNKGKFIGNCRSIK